MPKTTEVKNEPVDAQNLSEMKRMLDQIASVLPAMQQQLQAQQQVISQYAQLPTAVKIEPNSNGSTASPATTATTPGPGSRKKKLRAHPPLTPRRPDDLILPRHSKQAVDNASRAMVKLQDSGLNGEEFKARALDYYQAMGLKKAVKATRVTQVDVEGKKERETQNKAVVDQLRADQQNQDRWEEAHLRLKGALEAGVYKELVTNPGKDVNREEDFFDLWDRCLRKIGETREYTNLASKRTELQELKLAAGDTISGLMSTVEGLVNDVNTLAGTTRIPEEDKGWYFYCAVERSPFQKEFGPVLERVRPKVTGMSWRALTEKFLAAAPKDAKNRELPMTQQPSEEKKGELAMNAQERRGDQQGRRQANQQNRPQRDPQGAPQLQRSRDCRDWTSRGTCSWQQRTGRECRFAHDPQKRGRGRSGTGNSEAAIRNLVNLVEMIRGQRAQVSGQPQQPASVPPVPQQTQPQHVPAAVPAVRQAQQPQTGVAAHAGMDQDELDGILRLVEGLPDGWAHAGFTAENPYTDLSNDADEDSEDCHDQEASQGADVSGSDGHKEKEGVFGWLWGLMVMFLSVMMMPIKELGRRWYQKQPSRSTRRKKARKARDRQLKPGEAVAMGVTNMIPTEHEVLLDSGCSKSTTSLKGLLTKMRDTLVRMFTANGGCSLAKEEGLADIEGVKIRALFIPEFSKTLVSLGELDRMGITWKGGNGEWSLYKPDGTFWTTLRRGKDNLYRFTSVAKKA